MGVRPMRPSDRQDILALRLLLWPDDDGEDDPGETVLIWEQDGRVGGFVIYSLHPWAEGCEGRPVPYIEGWFVREDLRRRGVGRALASAVEDRARADGFRELGSDAPMANRVSLAAHRRLGFEPTEKLQFFRKNLSAVEPQAAVVVEPFHGSRAELLPLFAEADDSASEIRGYFELGEVFVARRGLRIVGHVQLIASGDVWEIKSVAVAEDMQGQGIGAALMRKALERAFSAGASRVLVATATADIGNLRFYQRLGFRMDRVEQDVFRPDRGYTNLEANGIQVRDRVWFSIGVEGRRRL